MKGVRFAFLDKTCLDKMLPLLFDILYANMSVIAPSGESYEDDRKQWLAAVRPAMEKGPRQIILMYEGEHLAGYFQYYVNHGTFMVEEIQLVREYQSTTLLLGLFRFLSRVLPADVECIVAYAHKRNLHSQAVIRRLGMEQAGENKNGNSWFYRGDFRKIAGRFGAFRK